MARMRSLKPEFWHDRKLARSLSRDARMLYMGLWNQADEHGRANADPRVVKGQVFPFDDDLTPDDVERLLKELGAARRIQLYEVDGDPFLHIPTLGRHQRLEADKVSPRHPAPPPVEEDQQTIPLDADLQVCAPPESDPSAAQTPPGRDPGAARAKHVAGSSKHVAGGRGPDRSARGTRIPDDFAVTDEMRSGARELGFTDRQIDAVTATFVDYWRAKPGAGGVKLDWPATWRNWMRREARDHPPPTGGRGSRPSWEL